MLEPTRPYGAPCRPYLSPLIAFGVAREPWQLCGYFELRRAIFCEETALFTSAGDERDPHDEIALPIVACSFSAGTPERVVGAVRIFEAEPGLFYGGRLGVERAYRRQPRVAAGLIATAVGSARALGCRRFLANVLLENTHYFARQHFRPLSPLCVRGRPHLLMEATLSAFPPCPSALVAGTRGAQEPRAA